MTTIYNWETDKSSFVLWDAKNSSGLKLLEVELKNRVPNGFHGLFVPQSDIIDFN